MKNLSYAVSFALFAVWMQRQKRWSKFFQALSGNVSLSGTRQGGGSTASSGSGTAAGATGQETTIGGGASPPNSHLQQTSAQ